MMISSYHRKKSRLVGNTWYFNFDVPSIVLSSVGPRAVHRQPMAAVHGVSARLNLHISPAYLGDVHAGICEQLNQSILR